MKKNPTMQLWYVWCTRKPGKRERYPRRWTYVTLATTKELAIALTREEHHWEAMEQEEGPGTWDAEPYGGISTLLHTVTVKKGES